MLGAYPLSVRELTTEKSLVINRSNGRWAIVTADAGAMLLSPDRSAEPALARLEKELDARGVLRPQFDAPAHLNTLILKITKRCNYGCTYCYDLEPDDKWADIEKDTAIAAVEEALDLARAPKTGLLHPDLGVILHGGEPTLRFGLIKEIVLAGEAHAKKIGKTVSFALQSNLSHLTNDMVDFSSAHQIAWGVSMDGPPALNDKLRVLKNGAGTYRFFSTALGKFPEFVRQCGVMTTITSNTQEHLLEIARHFRDLGMPIWKWSLFQSLGVARSSGSDFHYTAETVNEAWDELLDATERGEFDGFEVGPVLDYLSNLITGPGPDMCKRNGCGAARDLLSVSSDGTIEACDCIDRKGDLGGLGLIQIQTRTSLAKALQSDRANLIRSRDVARGKCGECSWLAVCGGTCLAHAREVHGISDEMCGVTMHIYTRLTKSMAASDRLRRYWNSIRAAREPWEQERLAALRGGARPAVAAGLEA